MKINNTLNPDTNSPSAYQLLDEQAAIVSRLGLPGTTTKDELRAILQANGGDTLPFKPAALLAVVDLYTAKTALTPDSALKFVLEKFPMLKAQPAPANAVKIPTSSVELLASLGLPADTTDDELNVILQANEGTTPPLKKAAYTAILRHTMRHKILPENEAREYVAQKFPVLNPPDGHKLTEAEAAEALRKQLIQTYGLPANASAEDIKAAAAASQDWITREKARRAQEEADEVVIAKKMLPGLTREQAIASIKRQRDHDAATVEKKAKNLPRLLEIIALNYPNLRAARHLARDDMGIMEGSEFQAAVEVYKKQLTAAAA